MPTTSERAICQRVIYNEGTVILAALRTCLGDAQFGQGLAVTAARKTSTTAEFLETVVQVAGRANREWLLAELKQ